MRTFYQYSTRNYAQNIKVTYFQMHLRQAYSFEYWRLAISLLNYFVEFNIVCRNARTWFEKENMKRLLRISHCSWTIYHIYDISSILNILRFELLNHLVLFIDLLILLKFAIVTPQLHFKPSCCYQHIHIQANYNVKTTLWSIWKRNPRKKVNFSRDASRDIASRYVLDLCRYVTSITPSIEIYKAVWNAWFNKLQFQCLK